MYSNEDYLIQLLTEAGHLLPDQVNNVRAKLGDDEIIPHLIDTGVLAESTIVEVSAANLGTHVVDLKSAYIDPAFASYLSLEHCRGFHAIPFADDGSCVSVALADVLNLEAHDSIPFIMQRECQFYAAPGKDIEDAWGQIFGDEVGNADAEVGNADAEEMVVVGDDHSDGADAPVITEAVGLEANQLATPPSLSPEDPEKQPEKRSLAKRCEFGVWLLCLPFIWYISFNLGLKSWQSCLLALGVVNAVLYALKEFERGR